MLSRNDRRRGRRERGQVIVLFALLLPVILTFGSIVVSAGNWYVLKKHLQTQVDAAALAGGPAFTGCAQDAPSTNIAIAQQALQYAGDTQRLPPSGTTYNLQLEDAGDQRVVLNSARYWNEGDVTNGSDVTLDNSLGAPCDVKFLDVKATDNKAPLLFRWIPIFPSPKSRARVEIDQIESTNGVKPIGVPEVDPVVVAALFVNENGNVNQAGPPTLVGPMGAGAKMVCQAGCYDLAQAKHLVPYTSPNPLAGLGVWSQDYNPVDLGNGSQDFGVVIVASRDPSVVLNGTLSSICSQNPVQTHCYSGGNLTSGISFIHAYNGGGSTPAVRDVDLGGGCGIDTTPPNLWSNPYFNIDDGTACAPIGIVAEVDFGAADDGGQDPTKPVAQGGVCADVTASPGGAMQYSGAGPTNGSLWTLAPAFTPGVESGQNQINLQWSTDTNGGCNGGNNGSGNFNKVAKPYVADNASGPVQYIKLDNLGPGGGGANSINKTSAANIRVTIGLSPPLVDSELSDPPIALRFGTGPSQTQALDCGSGAGPNGWRGKMVSGCDAWAINERSGSCASPYPDPPDCIDSENGNFNNKGLSDLIPDCSPPNQNHWTGSLPLPPASDKRWVTLFILDELAFSQPGKKTYPVRRFGMFYITAGDGLGCAGDDPSTVKRTEIWGHYVSYVTPGFGETIPKDIVCTFESADLCVSNLVE